MNPPRAPADLTARRAAEAVRWWIEAGVDIALDETPHDRLRRDRSPRRAEGRRLRPGDDSGRGGATSLAALVAPPDEAARSAAEAAGGPDARRIAFGASRPFRVAPEGDRDAAGFRRWGATEASIMLVGEAPGADEDRQGRPFVGRAEQVAGPGCSPRSVLDRTKVYIANVVPWRPPGNRTPTLQETTICLPFMMRQIALVNPRWLVCLGASATQTLLGTKEEDHAQPEASGAEYANEDGRASRSWPCRCFIPPICCASRARSAGPGPTCANSATRSTRRAEAGNPFPPCGQNGENFPAPFLPGGARGGARRGMNRVDT